MFIPYCDRTQLQYPSSVDPGLLELTIAALLPAQPTLSCSPPTLLSPPGACRQALDGGQGSISQDELPPRLARPAASGPPCPRVC